MWVLKSGYNNPDYYKGGTHQIRGEKVPNVSPTTDEAMRYSSYESADKMSNKLNIKYNGEYSFYPVEIE